MPQVPLQLIGRAEEVILPANSSQAVPARIDTGARTSSLWASNLVEKDRSLSFVLFDKQSPFYTGQIITTHDFTTMSVTSSTGHTQQRYAVKFAVHIKGRKIRATFTLADRSTQVYPILIGRNVLRGKFIVDVKQGERLLRKRKES